MTHEDQQRAERTIRDGTTELTRAEKTLRAAQTQRPKTACPNCGCRHSKVTDSRDVESYGPTYWRRRICLGCGAKYRTEEVTRALVDHKKSA